VTDQLKFAYLMAEMATAFDLGAPSKDKVSVYYKYLKDIPLENLANGVASVIKSHKGIGMPSIAEIREASLGLDEETIVTNALVAWNLACRRLSHIDRSIDDDIHQAVLMAFGSWRRFGETDPANEGFDRAHFFKCYKAVQQRNAKTLLLPEGKKPKQIEGGR
jgi:hypothetical protein